MPDIAKRPLGKAGPPARSWPQAQAEDTIPMKEAAVDQKEIGFTFTDEDFNRRYSPEKFRPAAPAPSAPPVQSPAAGPRLHGGANSFMRARRRRLAAASGSG
jgi:hypothetical protein